MGLRNGLLLLSVTLNLDSCNNNWKKAGTAAGLAFWVRFGGKKEATLCSNERFLHSETKVQVPIRINKILFWIMGTFWASLVWKLSPTFIRFSLEEVKGKLDLELFCSEKSRPLPFSRQIGKCPGTFLTKVFFSKVTACHRIVPFCRKGDLWAPWISLY